MLLFPRLLDRAMSSSNFFSVKIYPVVAEKIDKASF